MELQGTTRWSFVHEKIFPSQEKKGDKMFVFKILKVGHDSWIDLVQKIQLSGDLQDAWVKFDRVKRIKRYTAFACHMTLVIAK